MAERSDTRQRRLLVLSIVPPGTRPGSAAADRLPPTLPGVAALDVLTLTPPPDHGGRLKLGFHYALRHGFDLVAVVPSGWTGVSRGLADMVAPLVEGRADAVVGYRADTRRGRWLTRLQNRLARTRLTDAQSGCRAYTAGALRRIPFHFNSDGLRFETEVAIQLHLAGQRTVEVPITDVATERAAGAGPLRQAWGVLATSLKARAQELSLFFDRRFDCLPSTSSNVHYRPRLGFESTHTLALACIPPGARVLDIGCAGGYFGMMLRARGCQATGVDRLPLDDGNTLDAFHLHDLNQVPLPVDLAAFDYAVMLDVIEHLQSPETFIDAFREAAADNPSLRLIVSTPNVAFIVVRLMLLAGQFNYGKRGILDLTHTRLFTFGTFRRLFEQSGYDVELLRGVPAPFPLALGDRWFSRALLVVHRALIKVSRSLFAFQIFAIVRPKPGWQWLLDRAAIAAPEDHGALADATPRDGTAPR